MHQHQQLTELIRYYLIQKEDLDRPTRQLILLKNNNNNKKEEDPDIVSQGYFSP